MDRNKLLELKNAAEQKSVALNDRRTALQKELDEVTTELVRLQGDYRTYEQILAEFVEPPDPGMHKYLEDEIDNTVIKAEDKDENGSTTTD